MKLFRTAFALGCIAAAGMAGAAGMAPDTPKSAAGAPAASPHDVIPLANWQSNPQSFIESLTSKGPTKAATDLTTIFRPVALCRLLDTRVGASAAITPNAPYNPNTRHTIAAAGKCGIPSGGVVAAISLSFHVFNYTVNNGGYITFLTVGAPVAGTNAVFNTGAQWTAATANVGTLDDSGNFDIYIANSQVDVVVDINGYFQDFGLSGSQALDVGTRGLDVHGTGSWVFAAVQDGTGIGVYGYSTGAGPGVNATNIAGGPALSISGSVQAPGAGVNTSTFAFIHQVNTTPFGSGGTICGGFPEYTVIDHPMLNGDANAMVFVTARDSGSLPTQNAGSWVAFYIVSSCSPVVTANWAIRDRNGTAHINGSQFNVLVIKN